jgi:hypothetical protein
MLAPPIAAGAGTIDGGKEASPAGKNAVDATQGSFPKAPRSTIAAMRRHRAGSPEGPFTVVAYLTDRTFHNASPCPPGAPCQPIDWRLVLSDTAVRDPFAEPPPAGQTRADFVNNAFCPDPLESTMPSPPETARIRVRVVGKPSWNENGELTSFQVEACERIQPGHSRPALGF